jgi:hypothetical protein
VDVLEIREFFAVIGTLGGVFAIVAAVFVFRTAPDRRVAWRFAALLIFEGIMIWTARSGPLYWILPGGWTRFTFLVHFANDGLLVATHLPAVAVLVRSDLLAPFRSNRIAIAMFVVGILHAFVVFTFPDWYMRDTGTAMGMRSVTDALGPGTAMLFALLVVGYSVGLVAALLARHAARGPVARRQASFLAVAFGERDLTWGFIYLIGLYSFLFGVPDFVGSTPWVPVTIPTIGLIVYLGLTTYGVASAHLLDIDLKVKWTLERGTIAAVFIAVFFMVSEGAAAFLSDQLGSLIGILATGGLVFALAPLQRAAERFASEAMPSVQDTPEYRSYRKLQIYGEAVSEAARAGRVSAVERVVLSRLRDQLGLDPDEATSLEQELGLLVGAVD